MAKQFKRGRIDPQLQNRKREARLRVRAEEATLKAPGSRSQARQANEGSRSGRASRTREPNPWVAFRPIGDLSPRERSGMVLGVFVRESSYAQKENLERQLTSLRQTATSLGVPIAEEHEVIGPLRDACSREMTEVIDQFRGKVTHLLVETPDRLLRALGWHPVTNRLAYPHFRNWYALRLRFEQAGICLLSALKPANPASPESEVTKHRIALSKLRGHMRRTPGYKKRRREEQKPRALALRMQGRSIRSVSAEINVPPTTVWEWFKALV